MGRPRKKGLAYFPLDTDFISDRKIQRLFKKYGSEGITTYIATLCEIYATNGYYLEFNKDLCFDIGFTLNLGERKVENIIKFCNTVKLFDIFFVNAQKVLTSEAIKARYKEVFKRVRHQEPDMSFTQYPVVSESETLVFPRKTPTKGKGKGKGNTKEKSNTKKKNDYEHTQRSDDASLERKAEIDRMVLAATGK